MMLLYSMDGDTGWGERQTRFSGEAYAGEALDVKYTIVSKKEEKDYGILPVDYEISKAGRPVAISRCNLYRMKRWPANYEQKRIEPGAGPDRHESTTFSC